jgi:hypothetical protein
MNPVPLLRGAVRILAYAALALAVLLTTFLAGATVLSGVRGTPAFAPENLFAGLVCGLIGWLFVLVFHVRRETTLLGAPDRARFLHQVAAALEEMGYDVTAGPAGLDAQPGFHAFLFGGGIQVEVAGRQGRITGPKLSVERVRNRLRLNVHVQSTQEALLGDRRLADYLLKRAEITLQASPAQLRSVLTNVVDLLADEADVQCELHLLVRSGDGLRETTIDCQVRPWLDEQKIPCTIHKDFVKLNEPIRPADCAEELAV